MPGIGVIYNPKSGRNLRDPSGPRRLAQALGDHGTLRAAGSLDQLYRAAEDFRKLGIDVLAISGGDGTNGIAITGFLDVYGSNELPRFAFLRGGTMNTVANAVGVRRGSPETLLTRLTRTYEARGLAALRDESRHVMRIVGEGACAIDAGNPSIPPMPEKYGFLFGTGVVCGFLTEYYRGGGRPSPLVAGKTLARGVGSALVGGEMIRRMAEPFRGSVELADGTVWEERDYLAVAGGTIDQIGLNFRPFHRYAERAEHFHVLGIHTSAMGFVRQLPRVFRAVKMDPSSTYDETTSRVTIRSPKETLAYMVDGDLHVCRGPLHITIGPKIRLIVG